MSRVSFSVLLVVVGLLWLATPSLAFGAGNIASISKIEGKNWRHGDIEDTLKTLVFLKGGKWTSKMVKRVYFGNWLRDYSQAVDVGTLKGVPAGTLRVLVSVLAFMSFGYATEEYEVTDERLGCYRPEEHIDNPKDYADNLDARAYDPRLRPPVHPMELAVDPNTGMKNYIANESGGWATSSGYVKYSLDRSIHYGRLYTSGRGDLGGRDADLCEALRCLGQALHTLEDFSAHSNYCELVLRELGFDAFSHCGSGSQINLHGKHVFPIVTGTFGGLDFLHSVLGEAQDKLTQNELEEVDLALEEAHDSNKKSSSSRGFGGSSGGDNSSVLSGLLDQLPGSGGLGQECGRLKAESDAQEFANMNLGGSRAANPNDPYAQQQGAGGSGGINAYNPEELSRKIFPILQFRDRVMRSIEAAIEKIPGLTALVEKISEALSIFVFSVLAPFIRPVIAQVSIELGKGSDSVLSSSAAHQYEPWTDPHCTDPTHSLLSKDHFSNRLNEPCGNIASAVVSYVVPRVVFAWENPNTPVQMVLDDVCRVFHHPAIRDPQCEIHNTMFTTVKKWVDNQPDRSKINTWLGPQGVRQGLNHTNGIFGGGLEGGHGKVKDSDLAKKKRSGRPTSGQYKDPISSIAGAIGGSGLQNTVGGLLAGVGLGSSEEKKYKDKDYREKDYREKDYREKDYREKDYREKDYREKDYKSRDKDYYEKDYKSRDKDYYEKDKEKKHKKSSSSSSKKVKDEDYYRRKAEKKARREREGKSSKKKDKHKSRSVEEDSGDSDDSYESDGSRGGHSHRRELSVGGGGGGTSGGDRYRDRSRDSGSRDYPDAYQHDEFRDSHHSYSRGAQEDAYSVPGGFPVEGHKTDHRPPYPTESGADYALGQGLVIGGDGTVRRESPYEYPESGNPSYPHEGDYIPQYGSGGGGGGSSSSSYREQHHHHQHGGYEGRYESHSPAPPQQPYYQDFGYSSGGGEYHGTYDKGRYGY